MASEPNKIAESVRREQVGWIKFDGDEYHAFRYYYPGDRHRRCEIERDGYLPVYVECTDG